MTMTRVPINVPHAIASGTPFELMAFGAQPNAGYFQLRGGPFTGTYKLEASMVAPREDYWEQIGGDITAVQAAPVAIAAGYRYIRVRCTGYTSGEPFAYFNGEVQSD